MNDELKNTLVNQLQSLYVSDGGDAGDFLCISNFDRPLTIVAELIAFYDFQAHKFDPTVEAFTDRYSNAAQDQLVFKKSISSILRYSQNENATNHMNFIRSCAHLYLLTYSNSLSGTYKYQEYPCNQNPNAAILDLASGPDLINFIPKFRSDTEYFAIDKSLFSAECIKQKAKDLSFGNVYAINKCIKMVDRSDIKCGIIETVRAKNVFTYVPDFLSEIPKYFDWLCHKGKFFFQMSAKDPNENGIFLDQALMTFFESQITKGWHFSYDLGDSGNPLHLDSAIFMKNPLQSNANSSDRFDKFYAVIRGKQKT